ncbi:hypothetical protein GCM10010249_27390 [Streptomyces roseolilacinus]|uniref:Orc1-like AAA ATPase domain-containing protein n=1 Tax=Streptomyces roseolilacinus TaxID=66904 RepID=A0A918ELY6_9ACTN|nr:hypothetical protein GCM10010249_27390 [Streptomyces roseolilacinus]
MATAGGRRGREAAPLLERETELRTIEHALDDLCGTPSEGGHASRQGGVIGFAGPAGLGKTTLLTLLRRSAADRGCTVLSARGGEQERQVPFHVMRQLVQPVFAAMPEDERREILGDWYDIVAPATGLSAPKPDANPDPQGVRDGLDWVVTNLSVRSGPVVLTVDDVHWVDPESLAWLIAFAARARDLGMLIAVACRPDELPTTALPLHELVARNRSRAHELAPLTAAAVSRIVRARLGEHADEIFCRECWAITGGNPFEVVELTAKGSDRGLAPREESIPQLRDLASAVKGSGLIERLEQLGPSAVRLAWAAAVVGNGVPTAVVGTVAALGDSQLDDAAEQLDTARILTVLPNLKRERVVEFYHPLIATAVYRSIPHGVRVGMHGVAAQALVDEGHGAAAAARHMLEMHPEGDPWVVQQLRRAARDSFSATASPRARPRPPAATSPAPCANPRTSRTGHRSCSNSAPPTCRTSPPPPSTSCAPPWRSPRSGRTCGRPSRTGSPRPSPTPARWSRPPNSSPRRPAAPPAPARACACRPSSSSGTRSTPPSTTHAAAPDCWPSSPSASPAATSRSGTSSACAPGTSSCAASPSPSPSATPSRPCAAG